jgi:hypothetical protein
VLAGVVILLITGRDVLQIPDLLSLVLLVLQEGLRSQFGKLVSHGELANVAQCLVGHLIVRFKLLVLLEVLLIVDSHLKLGEILFLTRSELDGRVSLLLLLLSQVQGLVVELILVINDEVIRAISKGHN